MDNEVTVYDVFGDAEDDVCPYNPDGDCEHCDYQCPNGYNA